MVLAAALDVDADRDPFGRPVHLPEKFCTALPGCPPSRMPTGSDVVGTLIASVADRLAVEIVRARGHDLAAVLAHEGDRQPSIVLHRTRHLFKNAPDVGGVLERRPDERVHPARLVKFAGPIIRRRESRFFMHRDELRAVIFRKVSEASSRRGHGIERLAEMRRELRFLEIARHGIKRIEIVQFVRKRVRDADVSQHFGNEAVNGDAAHRADMDAPRERLLVAYQERLPFFSTGILYFLGNLVGPEHGHIVSRHHTNTLVWCHDTFSIV